MWLAIGSLAILIGLSVALLISVFDAGPILRQRVVQTLSDRFKSRVDLRAFHVTVRHGVQVSGDDLRIYGETDPNKSQPGIQPLFSIANFSFRTSIWNLLRTPMHIDTVALRGLSINIPPKNDRRQMARMRRKGSKAIPPRPVSCRWFSIFKTWLWTTRFPGSRSASAPIS
jgi:hypothetical protein